MPSRAYGRSRRTFLSYTLWRRGRYWSLPSKVCRHLAWAGFARCSSILSRLTRENTAEGTCSEVDYIMARDLKVLPIECKSGVSGKMKSLYEFMRQKHLTDAIRCSLENFAQLENRDKKDDNALRRIQILPLFAVSNVFSSF